jgi:FtsH-binding integral membrane protein
MTDRKTFVQKMYAIVLGELLLSTLFTIITVNSTSIDTWMGTYPEIALSMFILICIVTFLIFCIPFIVRMEPTNYLILGVFTIAQMYIIAYICSVMTTSIVLVTVFMVDFFIAGLTVYVFTMKTDFSTLIGSAWMLGFSSLPFLSYIIFDQTYIYEMLACWVCTFLIGFYFVYDSSQIVNRRQYELSDEDFILGALHIYIDVIFIFIGVFLLILKCLWWFLKKLCFGKKDK